LGPFINFNGISLSSGTAIITADNRGFRYGDGLFETMRVSQGRIVLASYHFERLADGMRLLQFKFPPSFITGKLAAEIPELCRRNGHTDFARVRLVVFRGNSGSDNPEDDLPHYIIQSGPLEAWDREWKGEGLLIDLFPGGRKSCDAFSSLKSNNYLLYSMAARYAQGQGWDDCLVLNSYGRIADSSIANLFYCKDGTIYTPPLSEGCVAGVMRRFLLETAQQSGFRVEEKMTGAEDLESAGEVFLTNSIRGIRRVGRFRQSVYAHALADALRDILLDALG
jgi:branched-chain amino acid aminotransferase